MKLTLCLVFVNGGVFTGFSAGSAQGNMGDYVCAV